MPCTLRFAPKTHLSTCFPRSVENGLVFSQRSLGDCLETATLSYPRHRFAILGAGKRFVPSWRLEYHEKFRTQDLVLVLYSPFFSIVCRTHLDFFIVTKQYSEVLFPRFSHTIFGWIDPPRTRIPAHATGIYPHMRGYPQCTLSTAQSSSSVGYESG